MAKQRIEKTLIVLDEREVRRALQLARQDDAQRIYEFVRDVIAKRVEAALRKRCR
jgi:hypothetical protein